MGLRVSPPQFLEPACSEHVAGSCRPQPAFRQANEVRKDCHSLVQHSQRALQKWPVRPRRPRVLGLVSLAPWPCRGRVGSCLRPGGRTEWDVLRCCGRLESARSETSEHQGNSETGSSAGGRTCPLSQGQSPVPQLQDSGHRAPGGNGCGSLSPSHVLGPGYVVTAP